MKKGIIVGGGIIAIGSIAYVIYKRSVPPHLTIRTFSPTTMEGTFEWGRSFGTLQGNGGFSAGWGWEAQVTPDATKQQYKMDITKNGKPYSSVTITDAGIYKI